LNNDKDRCPFCVLEIHIESVDGCSKRQLNDCRNAYSESYSDSLQIGKYTLSPHTAAKSILISKEDGEQVEYSIGELERQIDSLWDGKI